MGKYILTKKALEDLSDIWNYTFDTWSENQADKYYTMILENCENLADNPELGKTYERITENLKGFRAGKHVIFYMKHESDSILIVRILHGQMDLKKKIK
jgi:toxin ParE1/3/4